MIPLRIIVQPREKENIVFLNPLPPFKRSLTVKCPLHFVRISEKKTNEKFLPTVFTVTPVKNLSVNIHMKFFWNIHSSIHSWDRLKIFLNIISFTQRGAAVHNPVAL